MASNFPNLSPSTISQWPGASDNPLTRGWYPPFAITFAILTTTVLAARLCSQIKKSTTGLGIDDFFACVAWAFALLYTASTILGKGFLVAAITTPSMSAAQPDDPDSWIVVTEKVTVWSSACWLLRPILACEIVLTSHPGTLQYGFNRHIWDVPSRLYDRAALIEWLSGGTFLLSTCLSKISILCFYRRLEPVCPATLRRIIWMLIAFTAVYSLACLLAQVLLCQPTASYWRIPNPHRSVTRSCGNQQSIHVVEGSLDTLSTLYCIIVPGMVLRNIPMSNFQRKVFRAMAVASLMSVFGTTIVRAVFLVRLSLSSNGDATWNTFNVFVWSQVECQLLLTCASAPFLQRFASQYPRVPMAQVYLERKEPNGIGIFGRNTNPRNMDISRPRPQAARIPEWEFETLQLPRATHSPVDEQTYDRYVNGMYGPPAPPKDARELFEQYRREHGEVV